MISLEDRQALARYRGFSWAIGEQQKCYPEKIKNKKANHKIGLSV